jgi:putative ABC transport system permease protein
VIAKLVVENVRHRPVPTLLSILLIGVPVTLILILVGLSHGLVNDSKRRALGVGADVVLRAPSSTLMSGSGATIPEELIAKLATFPHVAQATGVVTQSAGGLLETATGIDPAAFDRMSGGFEFVEGHSFRAPNDIILDRYYAEQKKVRAGDKIHLMNHDWNVAGIVEPGKLSHIFVQIQVLQDLYNTPHMVSQIYLKLDDPKYTDAVVADLKSKLPGYPVYSMRDVVSMTSVDAVPMLSTFTNVIIGIGVLIAFVVVCLSMYMAVLQRTREIGILKAIGAPKGFILQIILAEALIMGLGGTVLGIALSYATRALLHMLVPSSLPQAIVYGWWPISGGIALGAALLGALYPGISAAQKDPIAALAYE